MKATVLDMRRNMKDILRALDQNEPVTILHRGKKKGVIIPAGMSETSGLSVSNHPAFGMWKDRGDMGDVEQFVRKLRKPRSHDL